MFANVQFHTRVQWQHNQLTGGITRESDPPRTLGHTDDEGHARQHALEAAGELKGRQRDRFLLPQHDVVFVADSQVERMEANLESMDNLRVNLAEQGYDLDKIPFVIQYNKRDVPNAAPLDELRKLLNPQGTIPDFEACATKGSGVFETLKSAAKMILKDLRSMSR